MATAKQLELLDDLAECPVCTQVFTDPRVLPCGHTFCRWCLERCSDGKRPGNRLPCPLCRNKFTLSRKGVNDLPNNFFVVEFLHARGFPTLTHIIPSRGKGGVTAMATLGDLLFVVRAHSKAVEGFDAETFTPQRLIAVSGLVGQGVYGNDIAACGRNLYLSDFINKICKVELSANYVLKRTWPVVSHPNGLSVNKAHNLDVACTLDNKLQEYTADGSLVREIHLQAGVTPPWHAVQLSTGQYAVSQRTYPGAVSVVGADGKVIRSYGQSQADAGQMQGPTSLAVTKNDNILVADTGSNRILSINTLTDSIQELTLPVEGGIQYPRGLCLDESRGRLYVGELGGEHRVLVFDGDKLKA